ncbi:MAG: roadblock/LC7 domain-containing protein [Streptomycetaceae bacterium]|jgi:predicted regulator of Ras-like GTPase activity (Roadblock/LC7/MglB family)|nr:roadblock/LC7 domain-containing protein [Streptomycetaceae bacterium]
MFSDNSSSSNPFDEQIYRMLHANLADVPELLGAVLLSDDGLAKSSFGFDRETVEHLAAAGTGYASLGRGLANGIQGGPLLHSVIKMADRTMIITNCGEGSTIVVVTGAKADMGAVMYEVLRVARAVGDFMGTAPRSNAAAT